MQHLKTWPLAALILLALAACGTSRMERTMGETIDRWAVLIRWNQFHALVDFMHPDYLEEHPVTEADVERLERYRVSEYRVRQHLVEPDGRGAERVVTIRLIHLASAHEVSLQHREVWRYDAEHERWLLHSGLPDVTQAR